MSQVLMEPQIEVITHQREREPLQEAVSISPSGIARNCPYFHAAHALNLPAERPAGKALLLGRKYHEAIEAYLESQNPQALKGLPVSAARRVAKILDTLRAQAAGGRLEIEKPLVKELPAVNAVLRGYPDIFIEGEDFVHVADGKSLARGALRTTEKLQLSFYAALVAADEKLRKKAKKILLSIFRISAGRLIPYATLEMKEAYEYYRRKLLPYAVKLGRNIWKWVNMLKEGKTPPARAGKHCEVCPYIFSCPIARRVPRTDEEKAAFFIVVSEQLKTIKASLEGKTIELPFTTIGPKVVEWEKVPGTNLSQVLDFINSLGNEYQRAMYLEKVASLTSGVPPSRTDSLREILSEVIALLISEKKAKAKGSPDEAKSLAREIKFLENFKFSSLLQKDGRVEFSIKHKETNGFPLIREENNGSV